VAAAAAGREQGSSREARRGRVGGGCPLISVLQTSFIEKLSCMKKVVDSA